MMHLAVEEEPIFGIQIEIIYFNPLMCILPHMGLPIVVIFLRNI